LRQAIKDCERKFDHASNAVRTIEREIRRTPPKSMQEAQKLVDGMVESVLSEGELVLHAMQPKPGSAENYTHALNVTVLSLVLAKSLDMTQTDASHLGLGAIFHDIGKSEIPDRISKKIDPLTKAEISLMQQHPGMGAKFSTDIGMPPEAIRIILQHHEYLDGSGYPSKLKQDQIDRLTRIVTVANIYDNLCNPLNPAQAMTPYEALSHMFSHQRSKCDPAILKLLIKSLGVYPPGSVVQLSSNVHGIVVSINPSKPLRPFVLLHAPDVPRDTPLLIDLGEEASLSITHCLRSTQLPKDALEYLNPAVRINYFFDKEKPALS
jgi:putative nucleotidyltransferase with HDIG domain